MKIFTNFFLLFLLSSLAVAQSDSLSNDSLPSPSKPKVSFGGFFDAYYLYDFDKPYGGN